MQLATGYCVLFSIWLWFGDRPLESYRLGELHDRLPDLADSLGQTARLSILTLVAIFVGGFVDRLLVAVQRPVIGRIFGRFDWDGLEDLAASADHVRTVERSRGEAEFRLHLLVVLGPTLLLFCVKIDDWWIQSGLFLIVVAIDHVAVKVHAIRFVSAATTVRKRKIDAEARKLFDEREEIARRVKRLLQTRDRAKGTIDESRIDLELEDLRSADALHEEQTAELQNLRRRLDDNVSELENLRKVNLALPTQALDTFLDRIQRLPNR